MLGASDKLVSSEQIQLAPLRAEVAQFKMERDILGKGNRIFKRGRCPKKEPEKAPGRARGGLKHASLGGFSTQSGPLEAPGWRVGKFLSVHCSQDWPGLRVGPDVGQGVPTQCAAPPRLQGNRSPWR